MKISEKNIPAKGIRIDILLFDKWNPEKSAMLVIGAKFGGCGNNREIIAIKINPKITLISPFGIDIEIFKIE